MFWSPVLKRVSRAGQRSSATNEPSPAKSSQYCHSEASDLRHEFARMKELEHELEKTPSQSSYPSPSPSHLGAGVFDSPLENGSPISPVTMNLSYMRAENSAAVTVMVNPANGSSLEDDSLAMAIPLPPPPPFASGSWEFFDPIDDWWGDFRNKGIDHSDLDENNVFNDRTLWHESERKAVKVFDSRATRNFGRGSSMEHDIKLYDEVKASESIRKESAQTPDLSTQVIDKTWAVVKDLHSRIRVALHSVNNISKRIEKKMRDEELQPQLVELTQGFLRMWKAMHECHHSQYITISQ
ncbi:hypothetical protein GQ457_05G014370 [Hibiscus cannabinus]